VVFHDDESCPVQRLRLPGSLEIQDQQIQYCRTGEHEISELIKFKTIQDPMAYCQCAGRYLHLGYQA
jgi:hypothetical protein